MKVDGLRPDIVIAKAAAALAAFENRTEVTLDDVLVAAELALSHRTREGGFLEPAAPQEIREAFTATVKKVFQFEKTGKMTKKEVEKRKFLKGKAVFWAKNEATEKEEEKAHKENFIKKLQRKRASLLFFLNRIFGGVIFGFGKKLKRNPKNAPMSEGFQKGSDRLRGETYEEKFEKRKGDLKGIPTVSDAAKTSEVSKGFPVISSLERKVISPSSFFLKMGKIKTRKLGVYAGRHAQAITTLHKGKPYGWKFPQGKPKDVHFPATIREAARKQGSREKPLETSLKICLQDVREKLRCYKAPLTMIFVVDLSGSMLLNLEAVKEALLKLHGNAYRFRDKVGIVALKGTSAVVVQHPITNLRVVANKLLNLRISGYTPLAAGMLKAWEILKEAKRRDSSTVPVMVLITDGSANVPLKRSIETGEARLIEEVRIIVREYEDLAIKDVTSVAKMIRREGIHTIVVNTNPHLYGKETYGLLVTKIIALITNGSHHVIGRLTTREDMIKNMIESIREDQTKIIST